MRGFILTGALLPVPQFKEIFLKNHHNCGAGVSIIGIYYTIFSKVLCSALCLNPPFPHEESHMQIYSESTA